VRIDKADTRPYEIHHGEGDDWMAPDGKPWPIIARTAHEDVAREIIESDENDPDGRSQWLWFRFPNGDLILGVFPQGDMYMASEEDHTRP
jgi:hypothetical protein